MKFAKEIRQLNPLMFENTHMMTHYLFRERPTFANLVIMSLIPVYV